MVQQEFQILFKKKNKQRLKMKNRFCDLKLFLIFYFYKGKSRLDPLKTQ